MTFNIWFLIVKFIWYENIQKNYIELLKNLYLLLFPILFQNVSLDKNKIRKMYFFIIFLYFVPHKQHFNYDIPVRSMMLVKHMLIEITILLILFSFFVMLICLLLSMYLSYWYIILFMRLKLGKSIKINIRCQVWACHLLECR